MENPDRGRERSRSRERKIIRRMTKEEERREKERLRIAALRDLERTDKSFRAVDRVVSEVEHIVMQSNPRLYDDVSFPADHRDFRQFLENAEEMIADWKEVVKKRERKRRTIVEELNLPAASGYEE